MAGNSWKLSRLGMSLGPRPLLLLTSLNSGRAGGCCSRDFRSGIRNLCSGFLNFYHSKSLGALSSNLQLNRRPLELRQSEVRLESSRRSSSFTPSDPNTCKEDPKSIKPGDVATYFDLSLSFTRSEKWKTQLVNTMLVYPEFISEEEEASIFNEIEPYMARLHYESAHWDDAIHAFRETERSLWNKKNEVVINRIREVAFPPDVPQLKLVHVLDLARAGLIKPHIDSVRFCGNTIAGLSLLSNCVMKLQHEVQTDFHCDVFLPQRSLYIMKEFARFEFTHEVLGETVSKFKGHDVKRERRISIICRNEPDKPVFMPLAI